MKLLFCRDIERSFPHQLPLPLGCPRRPMTADAACFTHQTTGAVNLTEPTSHITSHWKGDHTFPETRFRKLEPYWEPRKGWRVLPPSLKDMLEATTQHGSVRGLHSANPLLKAQATCIVNSDMSHRCYQGQQQARSWVRTFQGMSFTAYGVKRTQVIFSMGAKCESGIRVEDCGVSVLLNHAETKCPNCHTKPTYLSQNIWICDTWMLRQSGSSAN